MTGRKISERKLSADAFFLGFITLGSQIILLREFLLIFSNNELIIGLILAWWMILTAFGTRVFSFFRKKNFSPFLLQILFLFLAFYPLAAAFFIETLRNVFVSPGKVLSLWEVLVFILGILFPLNFAGGFLFAFINALYKKTGGAAKIYALEALGSLTAGLLVSLYFIWILGLNNFKILEYQLLVILIYLIIYDYRKRHYGLAISVFLIFLLTVVFLSFFDLNRVAKQNLYPFGKILATKDTFQGNITIIQTGNQINFFENSLLLFSTGDVIQKEEDVHYALLQHPRAKTVLLAGGAITGTLEEILKYPAIQKIDDIEQNEFLLQAGKQYAGFAPDEKVVLHTTDPYFFINHTKQKYDAILVNQPAPVNIALNRFYTVDFYKTVKNQLNPGGVFSTRLTYSPNYNDPDERLLQASLFNSLKKVFENVLVVPGEKLYFIASDRPLTFDYTKKLKKLKLKNQYVNTAYINDKLLFFKSENLVKNYPVDVFNYNLKPVAYYSYIGHWLGFFKSNLNYFVFPLLILIVIGFWWTKGFSKAIFVSGFTAASTEIVLIILFQILLGNIYWMIGLLITVFMAGLAAGSLGSYYFSLTDIKKVTLYVQTLSAFLFMGTAWFVLFYVFQINENISALIIIFLLFLVALLTGLQYGIIVHEKPLFVSSAYSADLYGAALGSLLPAIFLIPQIGLVNALFLMAGFNIVVVLIISINKKGI